MHFEFLVEDQSGKKMLDILVPKIIGPDHTIAIHAYKGLGRIPKNMRDAEDPTRRILLENLPKLLKGYGRTFAGYPSSYRAVVFIICDLDNKCLKEFREQLRAILASCNPLPDAKFCIAVEEVEAWFLGDVKAITDTYANAKIEILSLYVNDSICNTWETLADAVYAGGSEALSAKGWQVVGAQKSKWAEEITPNMDVAANMSPSFNYFCSKLKAFI